MRAMGMQMKHALVLALKIAVMLLMITIAIELVYHYRPFHWRIIKLICFLIERGLAWMYTFISFGFLLIFKVFDAVRMFCGFLLEIASTLGSAVCFVFRSFVKTCFFLLRAIIRIAILLIICTLVFLAGIVSVLLMTAWGHHVKNETRRLNPNDSATVVNGSSTHKNAAETTSTKATMSTPNTEHNVTKKTSVKVTQPTPYSVVNGSSTHKNAAETTSTKATMSTSNTEQNVTNNTSVKVTQPTPYSEHIHLDNPEAPICPEFILGKCKNGSQCTGHHCTLPYQWQYVHYDDRHWKSLDEKDNEMLEKLYCDETLQECLNTGIQKSFESDEFLHAQETYDVDISLDYKTLIIRNSKFAMIKFLRRLSTESYINSSNPLVTKWIWYWQDESGFWRMYGQDDTGKDLQESLEKAFWNKRKDFRFRIANRDYILTFDLSSSMSQTNVKYGTRKTVRRRPGEFVSRDAISQLRRSQKAFPADNQQEGSTRGTDKPSHWSQMPSKRPCQRVRLSPISDEFKEVEKLFKKSIKRSVVIVAIERVQNPFEWEKYQRKKENMAAAHAGSAKRRFVNEMRLFHGTNPEIVEAICKQNFDCRVNGKNATSYGQGSYFAVNSSKSDFYSTEDNKGSKFMFVAKVLVGFYTEGQSSYRRPPPKDPSNLASDLYDSCVDKMQSPTIFVVFQNDQCYPEYIIEYSTVRGGYQQPVARVSAPAPRR